MNETTTILIGLILPCLLTTLGAALVFFTSNSSRVFGAITNGLAAGIMLSASIWSLLVPAYETSTQTLGSLAVLPVAIGFALGNFFIIFLDLFSVFIFKRKNRPKNFAKVKNYNFLPKFCFKNGSKIAFSAFQQKSNYKNEEFQNKNFSNKKHSNKKFLNKNFNSKSQFSKNKNTSFSSNKETAKALKFFTVITIHNIPEGLSVGFAIGTAICAKTSTFPAVMLAVGIALQNFPEGLATALPLQKSLKNKSKAFFLAFLSGIVEPIFAGIGILLSAQISSLLPWLLTFSAGAMIYVIVQELLPEIHTNSKFPYGTWAFVFGFVLMMILDICL